MLNAAPRLNNGPSTATAASALARDIESNLANSSSQAAQTISDQNNNKAGQNTHIENNMTDKTNGAGTAGKAERSAVNSDSIHSTPALPAPTRVVQKQIESAQAISRRGFPLLSMPSDRLDARDRGRPILQHSSPLASRPSASPSGLVGSAPSGQRKMARDPQQRPHEWSKAYLLPRADKMIANVSEVYLRGGQGERGNRKLLGLIRAWITDRHMRMPSTRGGHGASNQGEPESEQSLHQGRKQ